MKRLIFIILLFLNYWANSQTTDIYSTRQVPGTGTYKNNQSNHFANSVFDQNLRVPSHASNGLYGAKDSSGYIYFNTTINRIIAYRGTGVWDTLATNSFINPNLVYKSGANQTITQLPTFSAGIATNGINSTDDINTTHNTTAVGVYGQNLSLHNNLNGFATAFVPQTTNTANVNIAVRNLAGTLALTSDFSAYATTIQLAGKADSTRLYGSVLPTYQLLSQKGAVNGYAGLDGSGKVPLSQLPANLLLYKGQWNPSTNTPTLANGTGTAGWVYEASSSGSANFGSGSIAFNQGDFVIYNGSTWELSAGVDRVTSVAINGLPAQQGIVNFTLTTDNVNEGSTNKYWTQARTDALYVPLASSYYIGTTLNTFNRASGSQTLTGINIDGNSGSTNNWGGRNADFTTAYSGIIIGFPVVASDGIMRLAGVSQVQSYLSLSGTNSGDNAPNSSTTYIGTTAVALNRASGALTMTGLTIDGGSNTLTNIGNASLVNSTISGVPLGGSLFGHVAGYGLSGSNYNGAFTQTWVADTTSAGGLMSKSRAAANYATKTSVSAINLQQVTNSGSTTTNSISNSSTQGYILTNGSTWNMNTNATSYNISETNVATWFSINKTTGNTTLIGNLSAANFNSTAPQTTINGSTSGTAVFSQPFQGSSYKKVNIKLNAMNGSVTYTFPTVFTVLPDIFLPNGFAGTVFSSTSLSMGSVTLTTTSALTLNLTIEGY